MSISSNFLLVLAAVFGHSQFKVRVMACVRVSVFMRVLAIVEEVSATRRTLS